MEDMFGYNHLSRVGVRVRFRLGFRFRFTFRGMFRFRFRGMFMYKSHRVVFITRRAPNQCKNTYYGKSMVTLQV